MNELQKQPDAENIDGSTVSTSQEDNAVKGGKIGIMI